MNAQQKRGPAALRADRGRERLTQSPSPRRTDLRSTARYYALFWFLSLAPLGLLLPYFALYLGECVGLRGTEIGAVFAVIPLVGLIAQPAWGVLADRGGRRIAVLVALNAGSALGYLALWWAEDLVAILVATAVTAIFARALIPIALSVSLPVLYGASPTFGRVRACGTLGFLAAAVGFPALVAAGIPADSCAGPAQGISLMFPLASGLAALAACAALALPAGDAAARSPAAEPAAGGARPGHWHQLLRSATYWRLIGLSTASFLCLAGPMELFPLLVTRGYGGDFATVSQLWLIMLLPEIALLLGLHRAHALGARGLLALGIGAGGLRWLLCGVLDSTAWLYAVQALHGAVVVGLLLGAPLYIHAVVPAELRSTAQALHSAVAPGLAGAASSLLAGWLLDLGGPAAPFATGGALCLVLVLLLPWWLPPPQPPGSPGGEREGRCRASNFSSTARARGPTWPLTASRPRPARRARS